MADSFDPNAPFVLVPVADPMIGTMIGSFVIVRLLGRGGMGAVYLAQHKAAPQVQCVFKTILAHLAGNALIINRFQIETEVASRLKHDNIVKLGDFGVLPNGQMFMQFEFVNGTPLDRFLAEHGGRLSLHRSLYLAFQVCDALDRAHAAGIVHRDLKPDNLLVVSDDEERLPRLVKVVDFGISKIIRSGEPAQTSSGMVMGSPYFMAVEQYANAAEATAKSDVFSLAIILWLMITGELPWGRPEQTVMYHLQCTVVPTPPPESVMRPAVAKLLLSCFSVDPDDRPTMRELAIDLAAVTPATEEAPSGSEILTHIARRFMDSAPNHARTLPHPVGSPEGVAARLWPRIKTSAAPPDGHDGRLPPLGVDTHSRPATPSDPVNAAAVPSSPGEAPEPPPLAPVQDVTARVSARALVLATPAASSSAATASPAAESRPSLPVAAAPGGRRPSVPVMAAMPTGLISQKYAAPDSPVAGLSALPRVRSIVAAAEIDLATGTPGPQPYAHAEVPRVLVSTTQLSGGTSPPKELAAQRVGHPGAPRESPPFVVLPEWARPPSRSTLRGRSRGKVALLGVGGLALVSIAIIATIRLVSTASDPVPALATSGAGQAHSTANADPAPGTAGTSDVSRTTSRIGPVAEAPASDGVRQLQPIDAGAASRPESDAWADIGVRPSPGDVSVPARLTKPTQTMEPVHITPPSTETPVDTRTANAPAAAPPLRRGGGSESPPVPKAAQTPQAPTVKKTGNLHILVTPWALCWVNGNALDQTPCILDNIPVGRYRLRLQNTVASKDETITVTVLPDQTTTIEREW